MPAPPLIAFPLFPNLWDLTVLRPRESTVSWKPLYTNKPDYLNVIVRKMLPAVIYISIQTTTPFFDLARKLSLPLPVSPFNAREPYAKLNLCGSKKM